MTIISTFLLLPAQFLGAAYQSNIEISTYNMAASYLRKLEAYIILGQGYSMLNLDQKNDLTTLSC